MKRIFIGNDRSLFDGSCNVERQTLTGFRFITEMRLDVLLNGWNTLSNSLNKLYLYG